MAADLIVYGVVAAGLIFWLRSLLGTKHGEERERPNPFDAQNYDQGENQEHSPIPGVDALKSGSMADRIRAMALETGKVASIENKTAEEGLIAIAEKDKGFDIDFFMDSVQEVFVMVIKGFASGDKDTLHDLLRDDVYGAFHAAISEREAIGNTMDAEIHAIRKAEVIKANLSGSMADVTIRFCADESRVEKDQQGNIVSGDPNRINKMIDIWTFSRDLSKDDPRWLLSETSSEDNDEDDNDLVPDTDKKV